MKTDEQHRLECEARHWKKFASRHGWRKWNEHMQRIGKKRGQAGLQKLLDEINSQR